MLVKKEGNHHLRDGLKGSSEHSSWLGGVFKRLGVFFRRKRYDGYHGSYDGEMVISW